jgi:hypothetical protein
VQGRDLRGELVEGFSESGRVFEERGEIAKEYAGLGEVGHVANIGAQVEAGWHAVIEARAAAGVNRREA